MKDRIRQIMESQHMTQQLFADFIGKSPATLSSIFTGRTRPTIEVVEAIKKKIPNINTDWLMFGSGDMYLSDETSDSAPLSSPPEGSERSFFDQSPMLNFEQPSVSSPQNTVQAAPIINSVKSTRPEIIREEVKYIDKPQRRIMEIRVFYDDQTYDTFVPAKK